MTPPAAAAAPRTRTRRTPPPARRTSGPARGRGRVAAATTGPPLALRLGGAVQTLAEHRLLDRLIRGRAWIAILGVGLIGIVFMQVSMLRMNAGIGRAVDTATQLERDNAALRASISGLSSGDRIEAAAQKLGLVPATGTPRFLDARNTDLSRAVAGITLPGQIPASALAATTTAPSPLAPTGVAPSPGTTTTSTAATGATPTTSSTTPTSTAPTSATSSPSTTTAPPATTPAATSPAAASPAATSAPAAATGGAAATGQAG